MFYPIISFAPAFRSLFFPEQERDADQIPLGGLKEYLSGGRGGGERLCDGFCATELAPEQRADGGCRAPTESKKTLSVDSMAAEVSTID